MNIFFAIIIAVSSTIAVKTVTPTNFQTPAYHLSTAD
jgi:hypothetical protein